MLEPYQGFMISEQKTLEVVTTEGSGTNEVCGPDLGWNGVRGDYSLPV